MKLSIIVVNQNTGFVIKETLKPLIADCSTLDFELIIVDNASSDNSVELIQTSFPFAKVIVNSVDAGIAGAGNQALQLAAGEYVLMVRPDTICTADSIAKMIAFMDSHAGAGGLSIRVLSPKGRFLPESIHGLSQPWISFLKFIGFAKNLPKTRLLNRRKNNWSEEFSVAEVDILNDSCMLFRGSALNQTGFLDDRFNLFGYNIDISYRLRLAGFKNYYFPRASIVKFESYRAGWFNWRYFKHYYGAMLLFAFKYAISLPKFKLKASRPILSVTYEVK